MQQRWAIAGTGRIAHAMAATLAAAPAATLVAACSRTQEAADAFAARYEDVRAHGSYEALADDDAVDVVYVATPNHRHHVDTLLFLRAGRHVVCEKPLALNARQVDEMAAAAKTVGRFLMEGLWSRFLPSYRRLAEIIASGGIGDVVQVDASFGFPAPRDPAGRLWDPALGGGSLLDLGVYPVQLAHLLLGRPATVEARAHLGPTAVDEQTIVLLSYESGALATAASAIRAWLPNTARVTGTLGSIELASPMHCTTSLDVHTAEGVERVEVPGGATQFEHEVAHVVACIAEGRTESPIMPVAASREIAAVLDAARCCIGLRYPEETPNP